MLRSIKQPENAQLGVAPTGEPALLASGGMDAGVQPASSERRAGCPQRTSGDTAGAIPSGPSRLAVAFCVFLLPFSARAADWNQWGGSPVRNNVSPAKNIPTEWQPGDFDPQTGAWKPETSENIAWVAALGSQSYGNPVVAGGKAYVG